MGINLKDINFLSLMPQYMGKNKTIESFCSILEPRVRQLSDDIKLCLLLPAVDRLEGQILDELAWELQVHFWDCAAGTAQKRQLIKSYINIHMTRGTPAAVEKLIKTMFGDGCVQEWFDYGGQPYMFRVVINDASVTTEKMQQFIKALDSVKNIRSWLEKVIITLLWNMNLYYAGIVHTGEKITIRQVG